MRNARALIAGLVALVLALALSACSATYENHGYMPTDEDVDQVQIGTDTRETVQTLLGSPGTSGILTDSGWYYVRSRFKHYAYHAPEEIERQVLAVSFDAGGKVTNVERFGLEDGQVIVLSRRVTETNIKGISILRQIFADFGRIDLSQLL